MSYRLDRGNLDRSDSPRKDRHAVLDIPSRILFGPHETLENDDEEQRGVTFTTVESVTESLKISSEQLKLWLKGGTKSTDDVFKAFSLDTAAEKGLANPQLQAWIGYMKLFNKKNPKKQTSLVTTLASHFEYDGLAKAIEAAKAVPQTAKLAKRLEFELIQRWLTQEKTPDEVFRLLKLDFRRYDLAGDDSAKMSELIPDESALVNMLIKAKGVASTEKLAQRVQAEQTKSWLQSERMPDDLFTLLRLDKADNDLLANPIFDAWIKYADDFREMYLKISMDPIATIDEHYSIAQVARMIVKATESPKTQKIAYRLNTEQYRDWLKRYHPAEAFMNLELGAAGDKLFRSPLLATWLKYVDFTTGVRKGR
ncbi:hypothetical protein GN244_ATG02486 [Phytophthora infestans]|uniref:RxLR effector PexRD54 WY domain-containing protein n=1 Tax=Phytophthora infestans TaxID=4787 RepID=A0A833T2K6_PHYIN|nr:hypothetical protein GN244_ATG02486 [Phytophthora infestans]